MVQDTCYDNAVLRKSTNSTVSISEPQCSQVFSDFKDVLSLTLRIPLQ